MLELTPTGNMPNGVRLYRNRSPKTSDTFRHKDRDKGGSIASRTFGQRGLSDCLSVGGGLFSRLAAPGQRQSWANHYWRGNTHLRPCRTRLQITFKSCSAWGIIRSISSRLGSAFQPIRFNRTACALRAVASAGTPVNSSLHALCTTTGVQ